MAHLPHHGRAVLLIERIARSNEEKLPVFLLGVLLPQEQQRMNHPLVSGFQPPAELLRPAGLLGLRPHHRQHTIFEHPLPGLTHSYWPYTRSFVEADELPQHQIPIGRSGWESVGHTVPKLPDNIPYPRTGGPKPQQPVLEADVVSPSRTCCPLQLSRDGIPHLVGDVHWHERQLFASFGLKYARRQREGARVLQVEDFQDSIACLGEDFHQMEDPALLPVGYPLVG